MRLPVIRGLIRRRLLVNYRVDPEVMQRFLPRPFQPKLHGGHAIAGICLIRLEQIRPAWLPSFLGIASENAAHRVAVKWEYPSGKEREGVYIPRRDTGSWLNFVTGGRVFPGEHSLAHFKVSDDIAQIAMSIRSRDGRVAVDLSGKESDELPPASCFESVAEASAFFEGGSDGYSATRDCCRLDGLRLETNGWKVRPLELERVTSSFFADESRFPAGSVQYDHTLIMRDLPHRWHGLGDMAIEAARPTVTEKAA